MNDINLNRSHGKAYDRKSVLVYKDGNYVGYYHKIEAAAKALNILKSEISKALKTGYVCHGYTFK